MSRLFAFGCSFTHYNWPTWADLLGMQFDEFYNYGQTGAGNLYISTALAEAIASHNINSSDTVMIMWTNVTREDRYVNEWLCPGNIFTQQTYPMDFVAKFVTVRGCYIRDFAQIYLVDKLLEKIGCKYEFMSMVDMNSHGQFSYNDDTPEIKDVLDLYKDSIIKCKPSMHKVIFNYDWNSKKIYPSEGRRSDPHPLPLEHVEYIQTVLPDYKFNDEAIKIAKKFDREVRESYMLTGTYLYTHEIKRHTVTRL